MSRRRPLLVLGSIALLALGWPAASPADHVTANPRASARLGEPIGDTAWAVLVDWSINCSGPGPGAARYGGNLSLVDADTREEIYMGGLASAAGTNSQPVNRKSTVRRLYPLIKAFCFDNVSVHGSDTVEATGPVVTVPALGDEGSGGDGGSSGGGGSGDRPGAPAGGQGGRDFPGSDFGGPTDPLRSGGCAPPVEGTSGADTLNGTSGPDLIFGLGGNDLIRGRSGHDCLIGGPGRDRLLGDGGHDRLTGGAGADRLVGGSGVNRYDAGSGNDVVDAVNGRRELVSCGSGRDRARVDRRDRVRGCERVTRV